MHRPPDSYGPWCGAPAAPHLVGPENIHDFGVCWFHTIAQLLEKISSVVHCVIFILKT